MGGGQQDSQQFNRTTAHRKQFSTDVKSSPQQLYSDQPQHHYYSNYKNSEPYNLPTSTKKSEKDTNNSKLVNQSHGTGSSTHNQMSANDNPTAAIQGHYFDHSGHALNPEKKKPLNKSPRTSSFIDQLKANQGKMFQIKNLNDMMEYTQFMRQNNKDLLCQLLTKSQRNSPRFDQSQV